MPASATYDGGAWLSDPGFREHATPKQAEWMDLVIEHGSLRAAARAKNMNVNAARSAIEAVRTKAALRGYAPGHFSDGVAPGYRMGKVTIQRGPNGVERVWERQHPDAELRALEMQARLDALRESVPKAKPLTAPARCNDDLLTVYPQGDPHAGLYAWEAETGEHFDLDEFERINKAAIDRAVASSPASATALFIDLGDSTHADNSKNRTPGHGHALDVHGRHGEVIRRVMSLKRYQMARLLEKHSRVIHRNNPGNHDEETALSLSIMLEAFYENEPRAQIVTSPNPYWYFGFGNNLIATTHGDGAKGKDLPLLMAVDAPDLWASSQHGTRVWHVGHVHHKDVKDYPGVTVEYHRTLAAPDNYTHAAGYRSKRTMEAVTYHRTDGEVERSTVGMAQIRRALAA